MKNQLKNIVKPLLPILFFCIAATAVIAQESNYKKNSIYASFGTVIWANQVSVSYDRTVYEWKALRAKAKVNFGQVLGNHYDSAENSRITWRYGTISAVHMYSIFEVNTGISLTQNSRQTGLVNNQNPTDLFLAADFYGSVGIRLEKDWFQFRTGIGNLEFIYVGLGANF